MAPANPDPGAVGPPPGGEPEFVEEEVAHGEAEAPPGPPPHGELREPAPADPNQPPPMTSGDPLGG